jgi:hypothetical protein
VAPVYGLFCERPLAVELIDVLRVDGQFIEDIAVEFDFVDEGTDKIATQLFPGGQA